MEKEILRRFDWPKGTETDESRALQLLRDVDSPSAVTTGSGVTLLHYACKHGWYGVVRALIEEYKSDPRCRTSIGRSPLYYACGSGNLRLVKYLIENQGISVNDLDKDGSTPLHSACRFHKLSIVQYLTSRKDCDPDLANSYEETPLSIALMYDCKMDIIRYLIDEKNCNPLRKDKRGCSPLLMANKEALMYLLCTGKLDKANPSDYMPPFSTFIVARQKHPLSYATVLFVMGNASAGKTTLVKVIQNRLTGTSPLSVVFDSFRKVSGVENHTIGIQPVHIDSKKHGHMILYDFAGQYEYYSSHAASLQNLLTNPGGLVLLVVDLSKGKEEVERTLCYWSSFLSNHYTSKGECKPPALVIGSHADVVRNRGEKADNQLKQYVQCVQNSLEIRASIAIDCRLMASSELTQICNVIGQRSDEVKKKIRLNIETQLLFYFMQEHFTMKAYKLSEVVAKLPNNWKLNDTYAQIKATKSDLLSELRILHNEGRILYLENSEDVENSWVILKEELLLAEVNGTIFAPNNFIQHHHFYNSTGIVPLSQVSSVFSEYDPEMIIGFMCYLQYCHEISTSEATMISGEQQDESSLGKSDRFYFFPALVQAERPAEILCQTHTGKHSKCGWILQRKRVHQFFSPRFLHILLLRIAFTFALSSDKDDDYTGEESYPFLQKRCNVWKAGIHWMNRDGLETIVEFVEQNSAVTVVMQCLEGSQLACARVHSELIRIIMDTKEEYSPAVSTREAIIHPCELSTYPLKKISFLITFTITELAVVLVEGKKLLTCKLRTKFEAIAIQDLIIFEPLACLSPAVLCQLFNESSCNSIANITHTAETREISPAQLHLLEVVLRIPSQDASSAPPPTERSLLQRWSREVPGATWMDLRVAIEQFSVFRGRNLLVSG